MYKKQVTFALILLYAIGQAFSQQLNVLGTYRFDSQREVKTNVYQLLPDSVIFFKADFDLDADGSPRAYHPNNTGTLHNDNGRDVKTGKWFAVVTENGVPVVQNSNDPFPGYYLSTTSLELKNYPPRDYRRYINADSIPYVVLPGGKQAEYRKMHMKLGDMALVYNTANNKYCYAVFADVGPGKIIGEGSLKLAQELGLPMYFNSKGRVRGGEDNGQILYILFPGSGNKNATEITIPYINQRTAFAHKHLGTVDELVQRVLATYKP